MNSPQKSTPEFQSPDFLKAHIQSILDFYQPHVMDNRGGFVHNFLDDGTPINPDKKHLVSSCRMIFNYCKAEQLTDNPMYREMWQKGLQFLRESHWQNERQGYIWTLDKIGRAHV